jgi:hypothetical protein
MELDEDAARDLQSLKKTLARYWKVEQHGGSSCTKSVFIETSFEQDAARGHHMTIDAVAVPNASASLSDNEDSE